VKLSRREFILSTSALVLARSAAGEPARLSRKECFFGLHFDLHPRAADTVLGRDVTDEMVSHLLESVRPDFIQYDSKGHPGYLGYPSKTGMSAPGIVQDSLAIWRRVTAAHGVALYNHFSGVLDGLAVTKHPEWARVGPDGKAEPVGSSRHDWQETSLFSPYERELMIPELTEAARNYDLDGCWVDGECWAVKPDYCEASRQMFAKRTGVDVLPKTPEDKGWNEFLEMQREEFRRYLSAWVDALHRAKPGIELTSNSMYSSFAPERPTIPLDYLSFDMGNNAAVRQARLEARYFSGCGKTWDLMSWGFEPQGQGHPGVSSSKPAAALEQEAAVVLAQGGAYQIYYGPTRAGWIDGRIIQTAAEVAQFCRQRQQWSHRSETVPEVGVLFSGRSLYRTANQVFGWWGEPKAPVVGAMEALLCCGYSVDLIPDWRLAECAERYPLMVLPDWLDIGGEAAATLTRYVHGGGKLLLCGAENALLFQSAFGLRLNGTPQKRTWLVADDSGFAQMTGNWMDIEAAAPQQVVAYGWPGSDTRRDSFPFAVEVQHGAGTVVVCPGPLASTFSDAATEILRAQIRSLVRPLHEPVVQLDGDYPQLEIVLRKKQGQTLIHFINTEGAEDTPEIRNLGVVPRTGPLRFLVRLPAAPSAVVLEPEGTALAGEYTAGAWRGVLPDLHLHSIVRIAEGS
jgi:hypothetical protein